MIADETILSQHLLDMFGNRPDFFYTQWVNTAEGAFGYKKSAGVELTAKIVEMHCRGALTLSLPAASETKTSKWLCFDGDTASGDLFRVESVLKQMGLNPLREGRRPGKDGHLWVLLREPLPAADVALFGKTIVETLSIDTADVEIYPKEYKGFGQMRLPLGKHRKPGADNVVGLFEDCPQESTWKQIEWLRIQPLSDIQLIRNVVGVLLNKNRCQDYYKDTQYIHIAYAGSTKVNWLDVFQDWRKLGGEFVRQCPLCEREGRDNHRDNLRVTADGLRINCVLGGPNTLHRTTDIYRACGF